jgi:lambda family phage portal protein
VANLIDKMAKALGFSRMVEAANWRPEERAWVQSQAQDSKVDISNGDRVRLLGLSRKLFYNNAIVRSAIRDKATYSVGSAIAPQANSGDPAWDDAAEAWWDNWSKSPEISERHDMRRLQMLVSEAIDRDGEIFCILTNKRDGAPAVQVVESHRVANPPDKADQIIDGVSLDRFARPLAYHVVEGDTFSQRTSRSIQADLMLHVYEPERPDQVRGYPAVAVALNNLLDRDELLRFEMQAAKIGSSIGLVVQNAQGGVGAEGFFGDLSKSTGESLTRETVFGGGMIPRLKATERIESFMMNRPNEKLDAHLEQYIRAAALGLGLPYEFIWDTSAVGGVAQRFIIQKAARAFAARQDVLISSFLGKLWNYAIANAIRSGQLPMNPNWRRVHWQTPRSITVDVGREAQARRDDVKAGLMTLADFFGEQGLDWKTAMQEIAAERQFAAELGVVVGVERTEGATVIDPVPTGDGGSTPPASTDADFAQLDCGTGKGGFKPGNDCAKKGQSKSPQPQETPKRTFPSKHKAISNFEKKIVNQDFESCLVVNENGEFVLRKDGEKSQIAFTRSEFRTIINTKNATFTHNHPGGSPFSEADFKAAADMNLYELRAVTKDSLYVIRKPNPNEFWPASGDEMAFELEQQGVDLAPKYNEAVKSGAMTPRQATIEWGHEACKNTAEVFGFHYERI